MRYDRVVMIRTCALTLVLAGCSSEPAHVEATVRLTLAGDDLAATKVELEAHAWIETHMHGDTTSSRTSLDVRMVLDSEVVPLPATTDHYEGAPRTGFPSAIELLADDAKLTLARSEPFGVTSAPIANGFRLTFAPPQAAGEAIYVDFSTASQVFVQVSGAGEGATYVDVPSDATNVRMTRGMHSDGSADADIILAGEVWVARYPLQL